MEPVKKLVHDFWDEASCGEDLYLKGTTKQDYLRCSAARYQLEPFIPVFAEFQKYRGKTVLEVGTGLGADHQQFAEAGAFLWGIDLTSRAINHVRQRFQTMNLSSVLSVGDAENLPFADGTFDLVYSWGVIHHTPETAKAAKEIMRILKQSGEFKEWSIINIHLSVICYGCVMDY